MSITEYTKRNQDPEKDVIEVRLSDAVRFIKDNRRLIVLWTGISLIAGILYAYSLPNEYTTMVRVMPELKSASGSGGLGDLKSLAGLAGFNIDNLGNSSEAIRPDLYPDILQSLPFTIYILAQPVTTVDNTKAQSLQDYLTHKSTSPSLSKIGQWFNKDESVPVLKSDGKEVALTVQQEQLNKKIGKRVSAVIDKKSGILSIMAQMPDPAVAAGVANQSLDYLTRYVTNYRTEKARKQVSFLTQQVNNARVRYESAELDLSNYRDRNRSVYLETAKIQEQRLQADYLLAQTVYNDLSKQLEQAKIKVQEEAPVFQILEPARVSPQKSAPNRLIIILGFTVFGAFLSVVFSTLRYIMFKTL